MNSPSAGAAMVWTQRFALGLAVRLQPLEGGRVDHRADIGARIGRIADDQRVHRPLEHRQHAVGDILLQQQQAQRRTALAGRAEGAGDDVDDDLFGQCGRIDDHRVDPAGLGDQRHQRARLVGEQGAGDAARGRGRAGEGDAHDPRVADQRFANLGAAGDEPQHIGRDAGLVRQRHRRGGDARRLRRRLGDDGVAGGQRGGDLAEEDRQREIPRRDGREDAAPVQAQRVALAGRAGQLARARMRRAPASA